MTKRKEILRQLKEFARERELEMRVKEGSNHTRIWVGKRYTTLPRHNEIDDKLAAKIYKQIGMTK